MLNTSAYDHQMSLIWALQRNSNAGDQDYLFVPESAMGTGEEGGFHSSGRRFKRNYLLSFNDDIFSKKKKNTHW